MTKRFYKIILLIFVTINCSAQSKQDIFEYLKIRIEQFSVNKKAELSLSGCMVKYRYGMTMSGNSPWVQENAFSLNAIREIFYVKEESKSAIVLKFKDEDNTVTDIESDGTRNFVEAKSSLTFVLYASGIDATEGKKMVGLFKKLAKTCGAKFIEL